MIQPSEDSSPNTALSGIKIVDLTQFEAGTSCTETLAWLGADVVKIEPPTGESGRFASTENKKLDSYYFIVLNANKRSVVCDLKTRQGKELLQKLIMKADVMIENMSPGGIERLGFGYDVVREMNPRIVYAQIKGFAPDGPYADYLSFDMIAQCMGSAFATTGTKGGPPLRPGPHVADTGAGLHCVIGILAALQQRERTGRGQRIEVTMQDTVVNFNRIAFAGQMMTGKAIERCGNQSAIGMSAPSELYACKPLGPNDYVFIYTSRGGNRHWDRLLQLIEREDLLNDARFASPEARIKNVEDVDALLGAWCGQHTKFEAMDILQRAGVPCGAVLDTMELTHDPHLRKRETFVTIEHPTRGKVDIPGCMIKMSESSVPVATAPLLGQHTEEVLSEWLGLSGAEIEEYKKAMAKR